MNTTRQEARKYVGRIKNQAKADYALDYLDYWQNGGRLPEHADYGISAMAAQAVRIRIQRYVTNDLS